MASNNAYTIQLNFWIKTGDKGEMKNSDMNVSNSQNEMNPLNRTLHSNMLVEFAKPDAVETEKWDKRNKVIVTRNSCMAQSAISLKMLVRVDEMTAT